MISLILLFPDWPEVVDLLDIISWLTWSCWSPWPPVQCPRTPAAQQSLPAQWNFSQSMRFSFLWTNSYILDLISWSFSSLIAPSAVIQMTTWAKTGLTHIHNSFNTSDTILSSGKWHIILWERKLIPSGKSTRGNWNTTHGSNTYFFERYIPIVHSGFICTVCINYVFMLFYFVHGFCIMNLWF